MYAKTNLKRLKQKSLRGVWTYGEKTSMESNNGLLFQPRTSYLLGHLCKMRNLSPKVLQIEPLHIGGVQLVS